MSDCCASPQIERTDLNICPVCQLKGKSVPIITLKSLLKPTALVMIDAKANYAFCANPKCQVVYFCGNHYFTKDELKVPVYQKEETDDIPVCYCFGWTRERLVIAIKDNQKPIEHIQEQLKANRCGCEVNNPQGSCCLGNVTAYIKSV